MMRTANLRLAMLCAAMCAAPVAAQQDDVPRELVDVLWLLNAYGPDRQVLYIGTLPESLRGLAGARDARVIGAVQRGRIVTAALAVRGDAAAVEDAWERRVEQAGWTRAAMPEDSRQRGFVSSRPASRQDHFCSPQDEGILRLSTIDAPGDETYVLINYSGASPPGSCGEARPMPRPSPLHALLPWLPPPPGAIVTGSGGGGSNDEVSQDATLRSELSPAALIAHYSGHMRDQGWTAVEQAAGENVALSVWRRTNDDGLQLFAWLSATLVPDGTRALQIRVRRIAGR